MRQVSSSLLGYSILASALLFPTLFATGCAKQACALDDADCDGVPDALGSAVLSADGNWVQHDFDGDGKGDGFAIDINGDGLSDGAIIDTTGDGLGDSVDLNGDKVADNPHPEDTTGGGVGGSPAVVAPSVGCQLDQVVQPTGATTAGRYFETDVTRGDMDYMMIANGWGANWESHTISIAGTSMVVENFQGSKQTNGAPAGYPSVFCGRYSNKDSFPCGLPADLAALTSLKTGLAWSHPDNNGIYNVAYDVWMGDAGQLTSYFMVWFKNPMGENPAGRKTVTDVVVPGIPGVWDIYAGSVNRLPIVNYVRPAGQESDSLEFDMMVFINDAKARGLNFPGSQVLSVAVGFEIWQGPVTGLSLDDFCLEVN